jgi:hypothetical protein
MANSPGGPVYHLGVVGIPVVYRLAAVGIAAAA